MTERILVVEDQEDLRLRDLLTGYDASRQSQDRPHSEGDANHCSLAMMEDEERARASGCDHCVTKP
jgi:CheY-like chemotaxis protein